MNQMSSRHLPSFVQQTELSGKKKEQKKIIKAQLRFEERFPPWRNAFCVDYFRCVFLRHIQGKFGKCDAGCRPRLFRHLIRDKQEACRALWRITCIAAAAMGRLEVPCMMPCNTPLYRSMWRLSSLLYRHAQDVTSFYFYILLCVELHLPLLDFFSHLFSPKVHWLLILIISVVSEHLSVECLREQELFFFWRLWHVKILKHYGLISYGIATYIQCMTSVLNCLQLGGTWGGGGWRWWWCVFSLLSR